jgi:hypothetical protein
VDAETAEDPEEGNGKKLDVLAVGDKVSRSGTKDAAYLFASVKEAWSRAETFAMAVAALFVVYRLTNCSMSLP